MPRLWLAIEVLADVKARHAAAWAAADCVALPADTGGSPPPLRPLDTYLLEPPTSEAECKRVLQALAADARKRKAHAVKAASTAPPTSFMPLPPTFTSQ